MKHQSLLLLVAMMAVLTGCSLFSLQETERYTQERSSSEGQEILEKQNEIETNNSAEQQNFDVLDYISAPEGINVYSYAKVPGARSMVYAEEGVLFVGSRGAGNIYAVEDKDQDGVGETVTTLRSGLYSPNGVALYEGDLYVAEISRILVFKDILNNIKENVPYEVVYDKLPKDAHHGWKYIAFGPDGKLYVPIGAPCNVCDRELPYNSIYRMNPDGSEFELVARGIRNTVGFTWHPETGDLWFTDNGRDMMGDDIPADELNKVSTLGEHFGYPYCHAGNVLDPQFGTGKSCDDYTAPVQNLGPHVAALGMIFYQGDMLPKEYQGDVLIAEHGSWNRSTPIGYRITRVKIAGDTPTYEIFIEGWLGEDGTRRGRPVDIIELPDGSLLISDDHRGNIFRVTYQKD